jgi:hypothetical protein
MLSIVHPIGYTGANGVDAIAPPGIIREFAVCIEDFYAFRDGALSSLGTQRQF